MRKGRKNSRVFRVSFVLVLVSLFVAAGTLYYLAGLPVVRHLPQNLPQYSASWARYVPDTAYQVIFRNYTAARALNSTAFSAGTLLQLSSPPFTIPFSSAHGFLTVVFSSPNATVDIVLVNRSSVLSLQQTLEEHGTAPLVQGDVRLYSTQLISPSKRANGWLATIPSDGAVGFSEGGLTARTVIESVLSVRNGTSQSLLSTSDSRRMFYVMGGPSNHLAFTVQNFPGLVRTGEKTLVTVDYNSSLVRTSYLVEFSTPDAALSQLGYAKGLYFTAQSFVVYDQYILATNDQAPSKLISAVAEVG